MMLSQCTHGFGMCGKGIAVARILVIDDEELFREILVAGLSAKGHDVATADGGEAGIAMARAQTPEIVITDLSMPNVTGWDVIRALKADAATQDTPMIALSAHEKAGDRDEAFTAGCDAYETKPLDLSRLGAKIDELLAG